MKNAANPEGNAAQQNRKVNARKSTAPIPSLHERHTLWKYQLRDLAGDLVMVSPEPITRAEADKSLRQHHGDRLVTLTAGVR